MSMLNNFLDAVDNGLMGWVLLLMSVGAWAYMKFSRRPKKKVIKYRLIREVDLPNNHIRTVYIPVDDETA